MRARTCERGNGREHTSIRPYSTRSGSHEQAGEEEGAQVHATQLQSGAHRLDAGSGSRIRSSCAAGRSLVRERGLPPVVCQSDGHSSQRIPEKEMAREKTYSVLAHGVIPVPIAHPSIHRLLRVRRCSAELAWNISCGGDTVPVLHDVVRRRQSALEHLSTRKRRPDRSQRT